MRGHVCKGSRFDSFNASYLAYFPLSMGWPCVISIRARRTSVIMSHKLAPLKKPSSSSISSIANLASALDVSILDLETAAGLHNDLRYKAKCIPKPGGKTRTVYNPSFILRKVQERINSRIFKQLIIWPDYLYGSIPNSADATGRFIDRDYIACARQHCGAKSLQKIDVENFFESIHQDFVVEIFSEFFKYPEPVTELLAQICCFEESLVQGALTSSYLATLSLWDVEHELVNILRRKKLIYTRLVDDISISSTRSNFNFDDAIYLTREMLLKKGLQLNTAKTKCLYSGIAPLEVHGLRINFPTPRLPAGEAKKIRAAVHNVELMSKVNNFRTSYTYRKYHNRCIGRVNKLARVGHSQHAPLMKKLLKIYPLPSSRDLEKMARALARLKASHKAKSGTRLYKRRHDIALYRNKIIARTYKKEAELNLAQLKLIKPK